MVLKRKCLNFLLYSLLFCFIECNSKNKTKKTTDTLVNSSLKEDTSDSGSDEGESNINTSEIISSDSSEINSSTQNQDNQSHNTQESYNTQESHSTQESHNNINTPQEQQDQIEDLVCSKDKVFHTGDYRGEEVEIKICRSGHSEVVYGTLKYDLFNVNHNGNCGGYSLIPLLMKAKPEWFDKMFSKIEKELVIELQPRSEELESNPFYRVLRYTNKENTFHKLLEDTQTLISYLKSDLPRELKSSETELILKFIKETILLNLFKNNKLNRDFYEGSGEFADAREEYVEGNESFGAKEQRGTAEKYGKNWWMSKFDLLDFWNFLSGDIPMKELNEVFRETFHNETIDVPQSQILTFKSPKVLITHQGDFFNYLVLKEE